MLECSDNIACQNEEFEGTSNKISNIYAWMLENVRSIMYSLNRWNKPGFPVAQTVVHGSININDSILRESKKFVPWMWCKRLWIIASVSRYVN